MITPFIVDDYKQYTLLPDKTVLKFDIFEEPVMEIGNKVHTYSGYSFVAISYHLPATVIFMPEEGKVMPTKRVILDNFEDVEGYPVGTIVRAMQWGDVAVKRRERKWLGTSAPSGKEIMDAPDEMFEEKIFWEFVGHGCQFISCDGPFMVVYNPEEEVVEKWLI